MQPNDWVLPQRVIELLKENGVKMSFELAVQVLRFMNLPGNVSRNGIGKEKIHKLDRGPTIEQMKGYLVRVYFEEILVDEMNKKRNLVACIVCDGMEKLKNSTLNTC
jgi:hypothetical protein